MECLSMPRCHGVDIEECSISQLQTYLNEGAFTSKDLTQCYLKRIELINARVKAVIETNPDALSIAEKLDEERSRGHVRTNLHGIPFIVKDNIATKDKMQTTAGCAALEGTVVPNDARIVTLLREAGAVLLGKANLSEWASMRASYYAEAYSSRGGQNRNPYNLAHHPGGSSSGSASAVASNMCAFSIGTETDGSIMFPADRNAVVGIKPTVGLTSTVGVIPESSSLDTTGPFGRSVEDAGIVLDIIREINPAFHSHDDLAMLPAQETSPSPYTSWLSNKDALRGAKFGLPWKLVWESASKSEAKTADYRCLMDLINQIEKIGAKIVKVDFPSAEEIIPPDGWDWTFAEGHTGSMLSEFRVVRREFYHSLRSYLAKLEPHTNGVCSLEDVVSYNVKNTGQEGGIPATHPAWPTGQDTFDQCLDSKDWPQDSYYNALNYIRRKSREEGIDAALDLNGDKLDGLLVPLQIDGGVACSLAAKAGYPMITVPVGVDNVGVPFGIGIIQRPWQEHILVKYGSAIEDLVGCRNLPKFLNFDADNYPLVGAPPESAPIL